GSRRAHCAPLGRPRTADRRSPCPLPYALVQMMAAPLPRRLIPVQARRGKHPVPHPLPPRRRQLTRESSRELHVTRSPREVRPVLPLDSPQMLPEPPAHPLPEHRYPVPRTLPPPHHDLPPPEIDVLHPQPDRLEQPP